MYVYSIRQIFNKLILYRPRQDGKNLDAKDQIDFKKLVREKNQKDESACEDQIDVRLLNLT
jgi:hypothetical protein